MRDCGGSGPTLLLVPSLINPPTILDLDPDCSLADILAAKHRVLLLDWGPAAKRKHLDLDGHVAERLVPLLDAAVPSILVGYCLGGTLALAAARQWSEAAAVVTLASPYRFDAYPLEARRQLRKREFIAGFEAGFDPGSRLRREEPEWEYGAISPEAWEASTNRGRRALPLRLRTSRDADTCRGNRPPER